MHRSSRSALVVALALACGIGPARAGEPPATPPPAPDWFDVEVLVFRNLQPGAGANETWPTDPGRPAVDDARELDPDRAVLEPYMAAPREGARLAEQWDQLARAPRYRPIAWFGWLQPPLERGRAPAVRLASPPPPAASAAPAGRPDPAFAFTAPAAPDAPPEPPPLRVPLDGTATVGLQRYLYVTLDLVFQPGDLPPLADGTPSPPFRLTETRRMRSKELHYFDHPLFGALVLITPRPAPPELVDPATGLPRAEPAR